MTCPNCKKANHAPTLGTAVKCLSCGHIFIQ